MENSAVQNFSAERLKNISTENKGAVKVFFAAIIGRLILFALAFAGIRLLGSARTLADIFPTAGDVPHYLYIAEHWYASSGEKANLIVFYPFFPICVAFFRLFFRSYIISAIIISYLSFGIAAAYFYKLLKLDYDNEKTAYGLVGLFAAVFGVFFISAHTESLFLMLTAMGLYYIRKKNWLAAGIVGFCAALTKTQGVLLFLPAVYEILTDALREKKFYKKSLFTLLVPLGFFCYLLLNYIYGGSFFKFVEYQAVAPWYNTSKWISDGLATSYATGISHFVLSMFIYWPQIIMYFIAVAAIFLGAKNKVRTSYLVFTGAYIGATYLQSWMLSGGRYISSCLTLYAIYASIENRLVKDIILLIETVLCVVYAVLWMQGQAIM